MDIRAVFDSLDQRKLETFIDNRQEENLHIDFKSVKGSELKSDDDKRNLAVALSGFANSDGGIIVWGIDARKNAEEVDCATEFKFIDDVELFLTRLNELTGDAVAPIIDGVLHKIIKFEGRKGCAATYVPASQSGPHMGKFKDYRYHKRSGSSFYRMEHFDIADMFGRRKRPELMMDVEIHPHEHPHYTVIKFFIKNIGKDVAKYFGANIELTASYGKIEIMRALPPLNDMSALNGGRMIFSFAENIAVLHPNGMRSYIGEIIINREQLKFHGLISLTFFCQHTQPKSAFTILPPLA